MTAANVRPLPNAAPVSADTPGIAGSRWLPDAAFDPGCEAIVMLGDDKARLVRQSATTMMMRAKVDAAALPLHGIVLLAGLPGTGKTTVARGLASRVAAGLPTQRRRFAARRHRGQGLPVTTHVRRFAAVPARTSAQTWRAVIDVVDPLPEARKRLGAGVSRLL